VRPRERLLLVGEDYGSSVEEYHFSKYALTGESGRRLAALAGMEPLKFYAITRRVNMVEYPDDWKSPDVVKRGRLLVVELVLRLDLPVILLGGKVAEALGLSRVPLYEWRSGGQVQFAKVPHPSGRNRYWNDPAHVEAASAFLRATLADA
jgi:uracil-DNA glycosylase